MPVLRAHQLSIFSDSKAQVIGKRLSDVYVPAESGSACGGAVEFTEPVSDAKAADVGLTGWAWDNTKNRTPDRVLIVVGGYIHGLGQFTRQRPDVGIAFGSSRMDASGWFGYMHPLGVGQDYTAYAVLGDGRSVCALANPIQLKRPGLAVFRSGTWFIGIMDGAGVKQTRMFHFGLPGDKPVAGDWDGSGVIRAGVFRDGAWFLDWNNNGEWDAGRPDVCVWRTRRPAGCRRLGWLGKIQNRSFSQWNLDSRLEWKRKTRCRRSYHSCLGVPGDMPVVGDWDGSGKQRIGVFRAGLWYLDMNGDFRFDGSDQIVRFGLPGDQPVAGDWSGLKRHKVGVFRAGQWLLDYNGNQESDPGDKSFALRSTRRSGAGVVKAVDFSRSPAIEGRTVSARPCTLGSGALLGMRLLHRIALIILVVWCALIAFPALPPPTGLGLDPSWVLGINLAHVQGLAMGRDLVWTYGPLAFLSIPNPAGQHMWSGFLYRMSMYLLWCAVLLRLCVWLVPPRRGFWMASLFGIVAAMDPFLAGDHLEAAALVLALTILLDESRWKSIELLLLSLLAAAAMLVRYNLGVELIGVFLALALQKDVRRQAFPAIAALPVAILGLYVAATGHITTLWPYFRNGWELASGYSEAMSVPGPPLAVFGTLVALVCLFGAALWISPRCPRVWAAMAAAAILAFFLFKNSTVRQDGPHVAPFFGKLALISLFFWILKSTRRAAASLVAFQIALLSTGYLFLDHEWPGMLPRVLSRLSLSETAGLARDYFHWPQTWRRFETEALRNLQPGWLPAPFHKAVGNGTVDAVPWNVSGVIANGWRWQPRPVFQSYAAFTPALDHLNARHIQSAAAADFALVNWETIDSRHPFFEDPVFLESPPRPLCIRL